MDLSLRQQLQKTLSTLEKAGIESDIIYNVDLDDIEKDRIYLKETMDNVTVTFIEQIQNNKVPYYKLESNILEWINERKKHVDIYDEFVQFWKNEGLEVKIKSDVEDNRILTLGILPNKTRNPNKEM